jgi:tetratricopeptide (TPR) repeat protein/transcriptional regulator with XRE-family HTH domain
MFSAEVRFHRQRLGLTQEDLAARTGVSVRSIRNLETRRTGRPRPGTVRLLADAFDLADAERDRFHQAALDDADQRPAVVSTDHASAGPARGRPVPAQLPADVAGFVGRTAELSHLTKLLDCGDLLNTVVISAIAGTAGVGKTCFAVHWAHQAVDRFPDGQLYLNLRGFGPAGTAVTPDEAVRSVLDALDVPENRVPVGLDAQAALYRSLLADRRMLVLLDNASDVDQVRPLLPGSPGCLVLVTSRNQLTGLVAGAGAVPLALDLLDPVDARDLLARRIGMERIAADPAAADTIIEQCARLPLALAVVAARAAIAPEVPLAALAADLRHLRDRLDTLATGDPATDVRSVFSWSCQQLSPPVARLFGLLGVHPGPDLSGSAAASLTGIPPARVAPMLGELVRAHLVTERGPGRYALHDLLRAYAGELVGDAPAEGQAALHRLLDHYLRCANRSAAVLDPTRAPIELIPPRDGVTVDDFESLATALDWYNAEYPVLVAALRLAIDAGLDRHAWQLSWSMAPFVSNRNSPDAIAIHRIGLQAARRLADLPAQGYSLRLLGKGYLLLGELDEAQTQFEQARQLYQELGDDLNQAHVHLGLGIIFTRQGRYRDGLHEEEQALPLFRAAGKRVPEATALNNLGYSHGRLGDHETALKYCQEALALHQELGNRSGVAQAWDSVGIAYHHLGRHADAVASYQQALPLFQDLGHRYSEADTWVNLGDTHDASGDTGAARGAWQSALAILTDLDHPDAESVRARLRDAR